MNVIISNKYQSMLDALNIDVMKTLHGEYDVDQIINEFRNFFFQRMIIDVTSIKDYKNIETLQKLSLSLDMDKIILFLDDSIENTNEYLSDLVSIGIYNFTKSIDGVMYLYNNPNSYRDVAHIQQGLVHGEEQNIGSPSTIVRTEYVQVPGVGTTTARIIGVKNLAHQSGATTLTYMMKKQLEYEYNVVAIEVEKDDFKFFNDKTLVSCKDSELFNTIAKHNDKDVILIDMNNSKEAKAVCQEIIYLVEPSVIKLNKMIFLNPNILKNFKNEKIILNQSLLTPKDVLEFEYEAGIKVYYNMPPLDEREKSIYQMNKFLSTLGFSKLISSDGENKKMNILGLFNK